MRQLMISLDRSILDPHSRAAGRMRQYGETDELFIIIPAPERAALDLSPTVHVQSTGGNKPQQFFRLLASGKRLIQERQIPAITAQDPFGTGLIGWFLKYETGAALTVQAHGDFYLSAYYRHGSLGEQLRWHLGKFVLRRATWVRAVGERVKRGVLSLGVAADKITVQPIAVDTAAIRAWAPRFSAREKYPGFGPIFLWLGRLDPVKNVPWLVKTFAAVVRERPRALLLLAGAGRAEARIRRLIKKLRLENNVKLEGWTADPWSYLKTVDALLLPSLSEGYGLAVMEAMAAGTRVIMNDVGVANYEVLPGESVQILPINNQEQWVKALRAI
ncbi:MAG: glycosyltransferase [Candidatus Magasanikbacteria bacterium]|nr:glycosyltransferase [Candidatus Magasanikbacteria bacterium]